MTYYIGTNIPNMQNHQEFLWVWDETWRSLRPSDVSFMSWDPSPWISSFYFSLIFSQHLINFVVLFTLISDILFEKILVNRILVPLCSNKKFKLNEKEKYISFWFNDWLYSYDITKYPKWLQKITAMPTKRRRLMDPNQLLAEDQNLSKEDMFIPFFQWRRYNHKHVRKLITRGEKLSQIEQYEQILRLLGTCFIWTLIRTAVSIPVEIYSNIGPLKVFMLLLLWIVSYLVWETILLDLVNIRFLIEEYNTPRLRIITAVVFYAIPLLSLFGGDIQYLVYDVFLPYSGRFGVKTSLWCKKWTVKCTKMLLAAYIVWVRIGFIYWASVGISGFLDNWWDTNVLARYEKNCYKTYLLDVYRIRLTDKILSLYGYLIISLEIIGRNWYSYWDPLLYEISLKLTEYRLRLQIPEQLVIIDDDIQIYQHTILDNIWLSIIKWIESSYDVNPIRFTGYSLWLLQSAWPGLATFLLAMIYRGLRFKGPDTIPTSGSPRVELPSRTPIFLFNSTYPRRIFEGYGIEWFKKAPPKLLTIAPKCKWQKYFVRWNWTYAFTLSFMHNFMYRAVFKIILGTSHLHLLSFSDVTMVKIKDGYIALEGILWIYGVLHCFFGLCPEVPGITKACLFHTGRYCNIIDKNFGLDTEVWFGKVFEAPPDERKQTKSMKAMIHYPWDLIEIRKTMVRKAPKLYIPRAKKIKIFIDVHLKKLKENIPKIIFFLIVLAFFVYSSRDDILFYLEREPLVKWDTLHFQFETFRGWCDEELDKLISAYLYYYDLSGD